MASLCTASGGYSPAWQTEWGTFEFWKDNRTGLSAPRACCACGGGEGAADRFIFTMKVEGVDFTALEASPTMVASFKSSIKTEVASGLGIDVQPENLQLDLTPGINVKVTVIPAKDASITGTMAAVEGVFGNSSLLSSFLTGVVQRINGVPGIAAAITGGAVAINEASQPTIPTSTRDTDPPTPVPTPAPTPYPQMGRVQYSLIRSPPFRNDGFDGDSYAPANVMTDVGGSWLAPNQKEQHNPELYFVMDMQLKHYVGELQVINCWDASCHHYFTNDYRVSVGEEDADGNITYTDTLSGALAISGEMQSAPVGFTGRFVKFECLSYGVAPGITSLQLMGNEVLQITSCEASDSASEKECHYAFDGITTQANNGWLEHPMAELKSSWIVVNVGNAPEVSRIGIISGIGREDHSINDFEVEVKTSGIFEEVTNLRFLQTVTNIATGQKIAGNRASCDGQNLLQLSFTPVYGTEAVKLTVHGSNDAGDNNAVLNEFYVYRAPPPQHQLRRHLRRFLVWARPPAGSAREARIAPPTTSANIAQSVEGTAKAGKSPSASSSSGLSLASGPHPRAAAAAAEHWRSATTSMVGRVPAVQIVISLLIPHGAWQMASMAWAGYPCGAPWPTGRLLA
jgi:hypothetical protein